MPKTIALIAVDNGLGHLKRQIILGDFLTSRLYSVTIYCNSRNTEKLLSNRKIKFIHCSIKVNDLFHRVNLINKYPILRDLDKYDIVLSDNILEIVNIRQDALLFASFFWHKAIKNVPKPYFDYCENLIRVNKPLIFSSSFFTSPYLKGYKNLVEVGLFSKISNTKKIKKDILISTGHGGEDLEFFESAVAPLLKLAEEKNFCIWVEPSLYKAGKSSQLKLATYESEMYNKIRIGICRPGVGTVTDLLKVEAFILMHYEKANLEMKNISRTIERLNLGKKVSNVADLASMVEDKWNKKSHNYNLLSFDGPQNVEKSMQLMLN